MLSLSESVSTSSAMVRQIQHTPNERDRADIQTLYEQMCALPPSANGPHPFELHLIGLAIKGLVPSNDNEGVAALNAMVYQFSEYLKASNPTDAIPSRTTVYFWVGEIKCGLTLRLREMKRTGDGEAQAGEWFYDAGLSISCAAEPSFWIGLKTLRYGAKDQPIQTMQHGWFISLHDLPDTVTASMEGKAFAEVVEQTDVLKEISGGNFADWIIAKAENAFNFGGDCIQLEISLAPPGVDLHAPYE